jgi:uncharacterized protein (TIGR00725 family)
MKKIQIVVLGSSGTICTKNAYKLAYEVGKELAKKNCIVLTGGGLGVMEAALKGAKEEDGTTLAIVPWEDKSYVNEYADIVVATGIGWSRNSINLNSCDGAIIVHGGVGTLNEATYAYMQKKPIVALTPSGGVAEELSNKYLDVRKTEKIHGSKTPKDAVEKILLLVKNVKKEKKILKRKDRLLLDQFEKQDWKIILKKQEEREEKNKTKKGME